MRSVLWCVRLLGRHRAIPHAADGCDDIRKLRFHFGGFVSALAARNGVEVQDDSLQRQFSVSKHVSLSRDGIVRASFHGYGVLGGHRGGVLCRLQFHVAQLADALRPNILRLRCQSGVLLELSDGRGALHARYGLPFGECGQCSVPIDAQRWRSLRSSPLPCLRWFCISRWVCPFRRKRRAHHRVLVAFAWVDGTQRDFPGKAVGDVEHGACAVEDDRAGGAGPSPCKKA